MKYLWFILFLTIGLYACKNKPNSPAANPVKTTTDSTKFYPLSDFINELLNKDITFKMTEDFTTCEYCNYKGMCSR